MVYVRSRDTDGTLHGILVEDERQSNSRATILAENGRLVATGNTPRVQLEHGSREEIDRKTGRLNVLTFDQDTVELESGKGAESMRFRDVTAKCRMHELLQPGPLPGAAERDFGKLAVEAHRRLTQPITVLISFALVSPGLGAHRHASSSHGNIWCAHCGRGWASWWGCWRLALAVSSLAATATWRSFR